MSAQTTYNFDAAKGVAGGIADLSPYAIDTLLNEAETGKMKFGIGVVSGTKKGVNVNIPDKTATAVNFEGITVNNRTTEFDTEGKLRVVKGKPVGVMRYGRVYARVSKGAVPEYFDNVYLITDGDEAGCFTNASGTNTIAIKGRFLGSVDSNGQVALVELFNQAND